MARPKTFTEPRKATAVRLPEPLHSQLRRVAYERDVSVNHLVIKPTQLQLWRSERTEQASNNAPVA